MDNLISTFENGLPLTRTSSDPNLNKHCQEGLSAPESSPATEEASADISNGVMAGAGLDNRKEEPQHQSPAKAPQDTESCEDPPEEPCFTTQPLPSPPLPSLPLSKNSTSTDTAVLQQIINPPLPPPLLSESTCRTAESTLSSSDKSEPCLPLPCNGTQPAAPTTPTSLLNDHYHPQSDSFSETADLLALKQLAPLLAMEGSTETLIGEDDPPPILPPPDDLIQNYPDEESGQVQPHKEKDNTRTELMKEQKQVLAAASVDSTQVTTHHLISHSPLSDLALLGCHWESVQGLVQSACSRSGHSRALHPNTYQSRRLASKLLRAQAFAISSGSQCCCRDDLCCPNSSLQSGLLCSTRTGPPTYLNSYSVQGHQLLPVSYSSPSTSSSPPPPQAPAYLDDDGLPVPMDAVQQRLRQIEAGYKQEVEVLRQQVRQLQMRLDSKQYSTPPSEPDIDYEDDIVSLLFLCALLIIFRMCSLLSVLSVF